MFELSSLPAGEFEYYAAGIKSYIEEGGRGGERPTARTVIPLSAFVRAR